MADLVAFNQQDADAILGLIDTTFETSLHSTHQPPQRGIKFGKSKSTGLAANSRGDVKLRVPVFGGWADGPDVEAWNQGAAIPANKLLLLIPIDGRLCALQVEC
jgi:hypothetical protein